MLELLMLLEPAMDMNLDYKTSIKCFWISDLRFHVNHVHHLILIIESKHQVHGSHTYHGSDQLVYAPTALTIWINY